MSSFAEVPDSWPSAEHYIAVAESKVAEALNHPDAAARLARYYARGGDYAGRTFLDVGPIDPYSFTSADLLALTLLDVQAPPVAVRRFLDGTRDTERLNALLAESALPVDGELATAEVSTLLSMESLYREVKPALSQANASQRDRWVTASKLCARKRPDLFPVRDSVVRDFLGLTSAKNYQVDWLVFRHLIQQRDIRDRVDELVQKAATEPDVEIGHPNRRLRHLDVLLWMHARVARRGERSGPAATEAAS
jgi:hypothetical protein